MEKTAEERTQRVQELSQQFLKSYVNPKMSRRGFMNAILPKQDALTPAIPEEVGKTHLTRRAIPTFFGLNQLFKWFGKQV